MISHLRMCLSINADACTVDVCAEKQRPNTHWLLAQTIPLKLAALVMKRKKRFRHTSPHSCSLAKSTV